MWKDNGQIADGHTGDAVVQIKYKHTTHSRQIDSKIQTGRYKAEKNRHATGIK